MEKRIYAMGEGDFDTFCGVLPQNLLVDGEEDSFVWKFENSGSFSVKSFSSQAYKMLYGSF